MWSIFNAISNGKSCLILMTFLLSCIDVRTVKFFSPAKSWLVNKNFRHVSRMQGHEWYEQLSDWPLIQNWQYLRWGTKKYLSSPNERTKLSCGHRDTVLRSFKNELPLKRKNAHNLHLWLDFFWVFLCKLSEEFRFLLNSWLKKTCIDTHEYPC